VREKPPLQIGCGKAPPCEVAANRDSDHRWRLERPFERHRITGSSFRSCIMRPDVIEKLNLSDGLQSARGHSDRAPDDARLRNGRVEDTGRPEAPLQVHGSLETPPFPFTCFRSSSWLLSATSWPNTYNPFIARHFVGQCRGHAFHHVTGSPEIVGLLRIAVKSRRRPENIRFTSKHSFRGGSARRLCPSPPGFRGPRRLRFFQLFLFDDSFADQK